jgi:hypothetical protein
LFDAVQAALASQARINNAALLTDRILKTAATG